MSITYLHRTYPDTHRAMHFFRLEEPGVIAIAKYKDHQYQLVFCLHPLDKRGMHSIVLLQYPDLANGFNRPFKDSEMRGFKLMMSLAFRVYATIFPCAQDATLQNNAHAFDDTDGQFLLGTPEEPLQLHGHIWGRGNPQIEYIPSLKLGGPKPGFVFNLRADGPEPGNERKIPWGPGEMSLAANYIKDKLIPLVPTEPDLEIEITKSG